ncbi:MAG: recombinase family protein [Candidatus Berkelbacteria bacterium]|nr:recombinase family protein [Candidatus Berkelbacteria bacterium]
MTVPSNGSGKTVTPEEIISRLDALEVLSRKNQIEPENYKYVIYTRKSTEDNEKQIKSIERQREACEELAAREGLRVIETIEETKSAKKSGVRPKFDWVINQLKLRRIHGVISWHPDRLSRNMKDAGEIIEMLDEGLIRDLKFVSYSFENSPSGKLLLAITFAVSKQYSDNLSVNVKSGNKSTLKSGKSIPDTHGYFKDGGRFLRPDGRNHELIKRASELRLEGCGQKEIAKFLNESDYKKAKGIGVIEHRNFVWSKQKLSRIFSNPVYCGIAHHGTDSTILSDSFDFEPMITREEYIRLNHSGKASGFMRDKKTRGNVVARLLNGKVFCGYCESSMHATLTKKNSNGKQTAYFFYRCDNTECSFKKKLGKRLHVKARVVTEFAVRTLGNLQLATEGTFNEYINVLMSEAKTNKRRLEHQLTGFLNEREKIKIELGKAVDRTQTSDIQVKRTFEEDVGQLKSRLTEIDSTIMETREAIEISKKALPTYSDFLELFKSIPEKISHARTLRHLDIILGSIFSNFFVTDRGVKQYLLREPYKSLEATYTVPSRSGG